MAELQITDYDYIGSAIGNAFFSGVPYEILWECVAGSDTRESLDEKVTEAISGKESLDTLVKTHYG